MKELYRIGSSSYDRKESLYLILESQLLSKLLEQEKIDSCFRITEEIQGNQYYFKINEMAKDIETIKIPQITMIPYKKTFSFKERINILFKGRC